MTWQNRIVALEEHRPGEIADHPRQWRTHDKHQAAALRGVLAEVGIADALLVYVSDGSLFPELKGQLTAIDGHLRKSLDQKADWPCLLLDVTDEEAVKLLATVDPLAALAGSDADALTALLEQVSTEDAAVQRLLDEIAAEAGMPEVNRVPAGEKPNPRQLPLDVIYTIQGADASCCLAVKAGLKYGIQSASFKICPCCGTMQGHELAFVDNNYFDYDHEQHLATVRQYRPKYATVQDVMTEAQCRKAGVRFTSLEQILAWSEELYRFAEEVIVIPKYDCLDEIPEKFMLGYSIPTSHGGTPLPVEMFKGRRLHLLGGSWQKQLEYLAFFGDAVVSLDNNYVQLQAIKFGDFIMPGGESQNLTEAGFGHLVNPRYVALAMSFGAMGADLKELYAGADNPA